MRGLDRLGSAAVRLENNEQRFARDVERFNTLVEQFRGIPYETLFAERAE